MENGCWFIIGPLAWVYGIAGFFTAVVKTPVLWFKEAQKYYEKGLERELQMADLRASQTAQNAFISQGFANEVDQLYNRLSNCPVPSTPVYGRTPIFTCNNNGCGCNGYNNLI